MFRWRTYVDVEAYSYDSLKRLSAAYYTTNNLVDPGLEQYMTPSGVSARVTTTGAATTAETLAPDGKVLSKFLYEPSGSAWDAVPGSQTNYFYLGGKALNWAENNIGSNAASQFWPYGQTVGGGGGGVFATYQPDTSGFLYADQRYYDAGWGRFLTADPSNANRDLSVSGSFNRFAYVNGDPANGMDPRGLDDADDIGPGSCFNPDGGVCGLPTGGGAGGGGTPSNNMCWWYGNCIQPNQFAGSNIFNGWYQEGSGYVGDLTAPESSASGSAALLAEPNDNDNGAAIYGPNYAAFENCMIPAQQAEAQAYATLGSQVSGQFTGLSAGSGATGMTLQGIVNLTKGLSFWGGMVESGLVWAGEAALAGGGYYLYESMNISAAYGAAYDQCFAQYPLQPIMTQPSPG